MRLKQIELNFRSIDGAVFEWDGKSTVNKE